MNRLTFAIFNFIDAINFFEEHILCQNTIYENYAEEKKRNKVHDIPAYRVGDRTGVVQRSDTPGRQRDYK